VEGHGKVTILLDENHRVLSARLHIVEFRGFERFIQGRPFWEVPVLVQRLCGICPVSHHLCAAKAMDGIVGHRPADADGEKMRRLMHYGQMFQSHALHFFHLACARPAVRVRRRPGRKRNVIGVIAEHPDLALQGREDAQVRPGDHPGHRGQEDPRHRRDSGRHQQEPLIAERDALLAGRPREDARVERKAVALARDYTGTQSSKSFADSLFRLESPLAGACRRRDGSLRRRLRAIDADGGHHSRPRRPRPISTFMAEEVRPWSYMKFPYLRELGAADGWYRVGPLARVNTCDFIDTPEAEARAARLPRLSGRPAEPGDDGLCTGPG
jgi:NAD-reducing hydrogenase large subunit